MTTNDYGPDDVITNVSVRIKTPDLAPDRYNEYKLEDGKGVAIGNSEGVLQVIEITYNSEGNLTEKALRFFGATVTIIDIEVLDGREMETLPLHRATEKTPSVIVAPVVDDDDGDDDELDDVLGEVEWDDEEEADDDGDEDVEKQTANVA